MSRASAALACRQLVRWLSLDHKARLFSSPRALANKRLGCFPHATGTTKQKLVCKQWAFLSGIGWLEARCMLMESHSSGAGQSKACKRRLPAAGKVGCLESAVETKPLCNSAGRNLFFPTLLLQPEAPQAPGLASCLRCSCSEPVSFVGSPEARSRIVLDSTSHTAELVQ